MLLISKIPTIVAAWDRIRKGLQVVDPREEGSHVANFLYMLRGKDADEEESRIFDICLILHAEHSFNASTFAAREIASTRAHMYASIGGAVGALSGELHGGANIQVMKMLLEIGDPNKAEAWVKDKLEQVEESWVWDMQYTRPPTLEQMSFQVCPEYVS